MKSHIDIIDNFFKKYFPELDYKNDIQIFGYVFNRIIFMDINNKIDINKHLYDLSIEIKNKFEI